MSHKSYFRIGLIFSLILHIGLVGLLVAAAYIKPVVKKKITHTKPVVQAVMVDQASVDQQIAKIRQAKAQQKSNDKARARKLKREKNRIKALEKQRKKRQAEKIVSDKLAAEAKKRQKSADANAAKSIAKAKKAEKAAADAKKKRIAADKAAAKAKAKRIADAKAEKAKKVAADKAAQKKRDKIRRDKLKREKEAAERVKREAALAQEMASEQAQLTKARQRAVLSEVEKYTALIINAIRRQWNVDESMKGKQCVLNIKLSSSGLVYNVKAISGDKYVCKSAQDAVYKARTLPVSKDPEVFAKLKEINLTVQPEFE
ncbi:MAG: cell envelope integrity protein TolA [Gammaproteobacteria bacterium]|nr:cell envelope integrity protein TolA [Gammaproteobacteria bacterium]